MKGKGVMVTVAILLLFIVTLLIGTVVFLITCISVKYKNVQYQENYSNSDTLLPDQSGLIYSPKQIDCFPFSGVGGCFIFG